jgi:tetratricopeptide (TPR) repeat protein
MVNRTYLAVLIAGLFHIGMTTVLPAQEEKNTSDSLQTIVNLMQRGEWRSVLDTARELAAKDANNAPLLYVADVAANVVGDYNQPPLGKFDFPFSDNQAMQTLQSWAGKLLDAHPRNSNLLILNGMLHTPVGDGNALQLIKYFEQARSIAPKDNFVLEILGAAYGEQGKFTLAIETLEKAIDIRPTSNGYSNLGVAVYKQGKVSTGEQYLKKAVELNARDAGAWFMLGTYYLERKRMQEAKQPLEKAVRLVPKMVQARWNLGGIYFYSGQRSKAIEQLKKIISIAPDSPMGRQAKQMLTELGG